MRGFVAVLAMFCLSASALADPARDTRWRDDLRALVTRLTAHHGNAWHRVSRERFMQAADQLWREVPTRPDAIVQARLARLVALIGDAHTGIERRHEAVFPLDVRWFPEGWYVMGAPGVHRSLLGAKLTAMNGVPMSQVIGRLRPYQSFSNIWNERGAVPALLVRPSFLQAAGLLTHKNVVLTVELQGHTRHITLVPDDQFADWKHTPTPLYRSDPDRAFWMREFSNLLYLKYNRCENAPGFKALANSLLTRLDSGRFRRLIVDLRGNGGGDSSVIRPLLDGLASRGWGKGRLIVLTDRHTFSSAMMNTVELKDLGATLVGEPPGERPNDWGEIKTFRLPHSKLEVSYATRFFRLTDGDPLTIEPDLTIIPTVQDVLAGRDPVLRAALELR